MAWIHAVDCDTPSSSPQGHCADFLSRAAYCVVSEIGTARTSRKIRRVAKALSEREPNFFGAFGTKSAL